MTIFNKKMITLAAITAIFAMGTVVYAEDAVVPASATITAPTLDLTTAPPTPMDFGSIINGSIAAGDSIIAMNSSANVASVPTILGGGDAALNGGNSGTVTVLSNVDATLNILATVLGTGSTPAADVLQTFSNETLAFPGSVVQNNTPGTLSVSAGVPETLHVGGLITVANDTTAGTYGANVTVSVNYP